MRITARLLLPAVPVLCATALLGCGSDDAPDGVAASDAAGATSSTTAPTTAAAPEAPCPSPQAPLRIVVVNDDGVANPAIDVLVERLGVEEGIEVTIVAPAEERSGSSDTATPGGATYQEVDTPSGHRAYSVNGFPADAVQVALDQLGMDPHLFLSGVNPGQNMGPMAAVSGTVGVGRAAVRRGYPALAVSAGIRFDEAQFAHAAELALGWIDETCVELVDGSAQVDTVTSINVPACPVERMGPLREVPRARALPEGVNVFESSCDQADPAPVDDIAAVRAGYPAISQVEPDLAGP